jgi:hypothetical protein
VEQKYLDWGGEIVRETSIVKVKGYGQQVIDLNNVSYSYDNLVWAADLKTFYRITDTEGYSRRVLAKFEKAKNRLMKKRGGDSVFTLFVEVDEPADSFRKIAHGHFFYSPSKQGLGETHWSELDGITETSDGVDKDRILKWLDKFLSLNTYEISIPALKDPSLAPEGKTGLIISILAEYELFKMIAEAGWYREFIAEMENRILHILTDAVYPMLKKKRLNHFSFTPLSYANRVGSSEGAITGWSFREPVPAVHKIQAANRAVDTPLPSVYQAGQWTYSPAGVPMSILTGKLAARKILKK